MAGDWTIYLQEEMERKLQTFEKSTNVKSKATKSKNQKVSNIEKNYKTLNNLFSLLEIFNCKQIHQIIDEVNKHRFNDLQTVN